MPDSHLKSHWNKSASSFKYWPGDRFQSQSTVATEHSPGRFLLVLTELPKQALVDRFLILDQSYPIGFIYINRNSLEILLWVIEGTKNFWWWFSSSSQNSSCHISFLGEYRFGFLTKYPLTVLRFQCALWCFWNRWIKKQKQNHSKNHIKRLQRHPYFCQQAACITCPQLPVWVPQGKSGCMKRGSSVSRMIRQKEITERTIT